MSRRRGRSIAVAQSIASPGLNVEDLDAFQSKCTQCMRGALGKESIGFDALQSHRRGEQVLVLLDDEGARAEVDGERYPLICLGPSPSSLYWLAVRMELEWYEGNQFLTAISLIIFEGQRVDEEKRALARAEWACGPKGADDVHAQPHWHVYPSSSAEALEALDSGFKSLTEVKVFDTDEAGAGASASPPLWKGGERFHYAMASRWHSQGRNSHRAELEGEMSLLKWLDGCVAYICAQLSFIAARRTYRS